MTYKTICSLAFAFLILPLVGAGVIAGLTKVSQVHAQEAARNGPVAHMSMMNTMMDGDDRKEMVEMMKKHHGENWKEGCVNMINDMEMTI
jgi:hypothetical protein